jgi:DNA-binding winged helix-turn-helix (wHTH) protein
MDVDTEWSRVLRILQVTEDQWVQNVLPKAREQNAIDVIETLLIEACLDVIEENMLTRPKTEQVIMDLHVCIQHVNNILRDVAIRLGLPVTVVNSSQI